MKKTAIVFSALALCGTAAYVSPTYVQAADSGVYSELRNKVINTFRNDIDSTRDDVGCSGTHNWCANYVTNVLSDCGITFPSDLQSKLNVTDITCSYMKLNRFHARQKYTFTCTVSGEYVGESMVNAAYDTSYVPKSGDLIIFNWSDSLSDGPDHIGFVNYVEDGRVHTVEGNSGTDRYRVKENDYSLSDGDIYGYIALDYGDDNYSGTIVNDDYFAPIASNKSRAKAIESAKSKLNKSNRPADYEQFSITFANEVLSASGAKSFYHYPSMDERSNTVYPSVLQFIDKYNENGAYFSADSGYVPRIGDLVALESNDNFEDGADELAIISGVNPSNGQIYIMKYDKSSDSVLDSKICDYKIHGYCVPFYEYDDLGDINFDGFVTCEDVEALYEYTDKSSSALTTYMKLCYDVNQNGVVNNIDLSDLQKQISKERTFEAETDMSSTIRDKEELTGKDCISATVNDSENYLVYGPYVNGLAEGNKTVAFRMKTDNNSADNEVVAVININDADKGTVIASREIRRSEFYTPDTYQDFYLEFDCPSTVDKFEFRVLYKKKAYIAVDKVTVSDEKVKTDMVFEAEKDLYSTIHSKSEYGTNGIEANETDKTGTLAYGPYVDKLALGTFKAEYYLQVDNNTKDSNDILTIDVYCPSKDKVIAQKTINRKDFTDAGKNQIFTLYFNNYDINDVYEFRTHFNGKANVIVDKVAVKHLDTENVLFFEAENDSMHITNNNGTVTDTGREISENGTVIYGPYTEKVSLGNNTAIFTAKITAVSSASDSDVVAVIDVNDATEMKIIATYSIKKSDIISDGKYSLPFSIDENQLGHKMEFRVTATGKAKIELDRVAVINNYGTQKTQSSAGGTTSSGSNGIVNRLQTDSDIKTSCGFTVEQLESAINKVNNGCEAIKYAAAAVALEKSHGINALFTLAVAIWEQGWTGLKNGPVNTTGANYGNYNVFNIEGSPNSSNGRWKDYSSYEDAFKGFGDLIMGSNYYGAGRTTPEEIGMRYCPPTASENENYPLWWKKVVEVAAMLTRRIIGD